MKADEKRAEQRERSILQIMQSCVHFTGVQHAQCKAGINYHAQFGEGFGCFANIPCTTSFNKGAAKECPRVKYPTREEAEAKRDADSKRMGTVMQAMVAAHADATAKGLGKEPKLKGGKGFLKCPVCPDGNIHYSVAGYNGHMHAGCTTKGCASWME